MTGAQLKAILTRHGLRQKDCAWVCGVHPRQARVWCNEESPVPQYAAIIMAALDEGLITPRWLARKIKKQPPN